MSERDRPVVKRADATPRKDLAVGKDASLQVLVGRVEVTGQPATVVEEGCLVELTHERHAVTALEDCVFLLTTVTGLESEQISRG